MLFPYLELHQINMKTIISVCRPPGATSSRLDGPSEKVRFSQNKLMLPAGAREAPTVLLVNNMKSLVLSATRERKGAVEEDTACPCNKFHFREKIFREKTSLMP